jgi:hypothetical protein
MGEVRPAELRGADIKSISRSGEDEASVEMANGKLHEIYLDDLIEDWLFLHRKLQRVKAWTVRQKEASK